MQSYSNINVQCFTFFVFLDGGALKRMFLIAAKNRFCISGCMSKVVVRFSSDVINQAFLQMSSIAAIEQIKSLPIIE